MSRPDPNTTRAHWDSMAATYDQAKDRNAVYYAALKRCFDQAVPCEFRGRVLEVGCGTGQILASLQPQLGIGIDSSAGMIEQARRQFVDRPELSFDVADAAALTGMGGFDAVISADVLEHVKSWPEVVRAMVASCRVGGVLSVSTPNPRWTFPLWVLEKLRLKMPEGPHQFVHAREIAARFRALDCKVESVQTHLILPLNLAGLGPAISHWSARLPLLRGLGVIQMIVAHRHA